MIIDKPEHIELYTMMVQKQALKLEIYGMKTRGRSAYALIKEIYGLKGSKQKVLEQFTEMIEELSYIPLPQDVIPWTEEDYADIENLKSLGTERRNK